MPVDTKLLLGWMEEREAMHWLLREYRGNKPFTEQSAKDLWNEHREKVSKLGDRDCAPPVRLADRTQKEEYAEHHFMQNNGKCNSVLGVLKLDDPGKLVIHQLSVSLSQSEGYLDGMRDPKQRLRLGLGRGRHYEGILPKARREGDCLIKSVPHAEWFPVSCNQEDFEVKEGNRWIAVKEFDNRLLLSAGYHRAHMSIYRSKPDDIVLPLFVVLESDTVDGFFSVNSKVPFKRDLARSSCPPVLADFFNESLCITLPLRKFRPEIQVNLKMGVWDILWPDAE
jgi:hypothetical protein